MLDEVSQSCSCSLRELAETLVRPAALSADPALIAGELRREREPLIARELSRASLDRTQLLAYEHARLDIGGEINDLCTGLAVVRIERRGVLQRRLHRAATAERTAAIVDPREQLQLERMGNVPAARERASGVRVSDQLQRRLAEAVLEILTAKSVAVGAQQQLAPSARDERDFVGRAEAAAGRR